MPPLNWHSLRVTLTPADARKHAGRRVDVHLVAGGGHSSANDSTIEVLRCSPSDTSSMVLFFLVRHIELRWVVAWRGFLGVLVL